MEGYRIAGRRRRRRRGPLALTDTHTHTRTPTFCFQLPCIYVAPPPCSLKCCCCWTGKAKQKKREAKMELEPFSQLRAPKENLIHSFIGSVQKKGEQDLFPLTLYFADVSFIIETGSLPDARLSPLVCVQLSGQGLQVLIKELDSQSINWSRGFEFIFYEWNHQRMIT